jgi:hypothetical protein
VTNTRPEGFSDVPRPTMDANYKEYLRMILRWRALAKRDAPEEQIDGLSEDIGKVWSDLDPNQRRSLSGIVSDQTWIDRDAAPNWIATPKESVTDDMLCDWIAAVFRNDHHAILHYTRFCVNALPPLAVAFVRGKAYRALGLTEVADEMDAFAKKLSEKGETT